MHLSFYKCYLCSFWGPVNRQYLNHAGTAGKFAAWISIEPVAHNLYGDGLVHSVSLNESKSPVAPTLKHIFKVDTYASAIACESHASHSSSCSAALAEMSSLFRRQTRSSCYCYSLVYIAGLCYQWLKTDADMGDVLRTGELILLKVKWSTITKSDPEIHHF